MEPQKSGELPVIVNTPEKSSERPNKVKQRKTWDRKKWVVLPLVLPLVLWLCFFLVLPYINLFGYSFWKAGPFDVIKEFTLENYIKFFASENTVHPTYLVLFDTLKLALTVTFFTILLSLPLAYFIRFKVMRFKQALYTLVIIPLWVSYIVRAYSWKIILGSNGILNSFLIWLGVTKEPLEFLLYSQVSVTIAMIHIYLPFVLMPIYTSLEQIPTNLLEASKDLGANRLKTFFQIVFPLALPGIIAGGTFAFILSMGDFLAPSLLGGAESSTMIANIMQQQFGTSNNWPYGAAMGIIILILVLAVLKMTGQAEKRFSAIDAKNGK